MRVEGQARAARPDKSALLRAPAGSGKTGALVGRLLHLMSAGAEPSDIAAITFTEKAAAEMKERLYKTLGDPGLCRLTAKDALELLPDDAPYPLTLTLEEIFSKLVREPDSLKVSTIHAFLLDMLRAHPLAAGLPADFEVLPETALLLRREAAVDEVIKALEKGALPNEYDELYRAGYDVRKLRVLIALSLEKRGAVNRARASSGGLKAEIERSNTLLREMVESGAAQSLAGRALELIPELLDGPFSAALGRLSALKDPDGLPDIYEGIKELFYKTDGGPRDKIPPAKKDFTEVYGKAEGAAKRVRWEEIYPELRESFSGLAYLFDSYISAEAKDAFLKLSALSSEVYRAMCLRDGFIDFEDIELYALKLLSSRPDIRVPKHLLVDEFQDTSQIQWDLLYKMAEEQFSGQGVEGPECPTFFVVGDVNQSIYRFRKAEPRLMKDLRPLMEERIVLARRDFPELDINFRSAPEITRFTDETFAPLLGQDYRGGRAARQGFTGSVRLRVAADEAGALAEEAIRALGFDVSADGEIRKAHFGDMAVLIQKRTLLKEYERAFRENGIPFQVSGGTGFFQQDEVLTILSVLKFLENPLDVFSLRQALKSPLFGIPEWIIPPLAGKGPLAEIPEIFAAAGQPDASELFERWIDMAKTMTLSELVDSVIKESSAYPRLGAVGGAQAVFNIDKLSALAREFEAGGAKGAGGGGGGAGGGLHDFIQWVREYRRGEDLPSAGIRAADSKYLTIMTVHSAKGLEFPVVFLPGMGAGTRNGTDDVLFGPPGGGGQPLFAIRTESLLEQNKDYQELKDLEAGERAWERKRLFYVAVTRARDHLVMLSGKPEGARDTFLRLLIDEEARHLAPPPGCLFPEGFSAEVSEYEYPARDSRETAHPLPRPLGAGPDPRPSVGDGGERAERGGRGNNLPPPENLAPLAPLPGGGGRRFVSPSSLADHALIKAAGPESSPGGSIVTGKLVHEALESFGRTGGYGLTKLSSFGQSTRQEAREAEKILSGLLSDAKMRELLSAGAGKYFELPLLIRSTDDVVYGFADLVIVEGEKARVIDFKTGISELPEELCAAAYRPQLEAYAEAVRAVFGVRVVEKYLLVAETCKLLLV
jgi:ATP-dependent exoDNAse (exonuclease V) beta subunit